MWIGGILTGVLWVVGWDCVRFGVTPRAWGSFKALMIDVAKISGSLSTKDVLEQYDTFA
jgi:hypothetical protein